MNTFPAFILLVAYAIGHLYNLLFTDEEAWERTLSLLIFLFALYALWSLWR